MIPNGGDIIEEYNELNPVKEYANWHNNVEDTEDKDVSIADDVSNIQIEYNNSRKHGQSNCYSSDLNNDY
jgi:hypothetical protein